jgi:hypothetical protein
MLIPMTHGTDRWTLGFAITGLACWLLMFGAGTDVWHDIGRPDIAARLSERGATLSDIRAYTYAFYGLFVVLAAQLIASGFDVWRSRLRPRL